ncbi:hypothetical protein [Emticicia oligotrophica]|uniref:hypothetical protein n=1 Tax=Emticicia oligotrophica TaxID=312279 RepID=UPI00273CDFD6|nr:hypothetical protein [Emticicia oligotrophica]
MKNYFTPEWLSWVFTFAISIPIILIASFAKRNSPPRKQNYVFIGIIAFYVIYFFYVFFAGKLGLFQTVSLPPNILLFTTFPYAIFLFALIDKLPMPKQIFEKSSINDLIGLHIFRFIGSTFIVLALYDSLPKTFAFIAGFGDVIAAITSIFVVNAIKKQKPYSKNLILVWNTFGLIDIIITAVLANFFTKVSIDTGVMGVDTLAKFPFSLIPAFAPPTIFFLHVLIYRKLKKKSR